MFFALRPEDVKNYTVKEALMSVDFYLAYFINFFNGASVGMISATIKVIYFFTIIAKICIAFSPNPKCLFQEYGKEAQFDDTFLSTILQVSAVFNCVGRVMWGFIGDHLSFKVSWV